jgi:L-ascorbate metabolism protein UlaG (beta-lactamase superfamily)
MKNSKRAAQLLFISLAYLYSLNVVAHGDKHAAEGAAATYLGNEAVLISTAVGNVLFDPFFHNDYGSYQLVPKDIRQAIFAGEAPYNNISVIVISHAHGDHFSAEDTLAYLQKNKTTKLVAPKQAAVLIEALDGGKAISSQLVAIELAVGDKPSKHSVGPIDIESVRIPHAGWPERKEVANLVHRVSFRGKLSVIHMGDSDPNDIHFEPYKEHWESTQTNMAFPPYWFFTSTQGNMILDERINALKTIGVHVPIDIPSDLKNNEYDYFSKPGEHRDITN